LEEEMRKILLVLLALMVVFGLVIGCNDGDYPLNPYTGTTNPDAPWYNNPEIDYTPPAAYAVPGWWAPLVGLDAAATVPIVDGDGKKLTAIALQGDAKWSDEYTGPGAGIYTGSDAVFMGRPTGGSTHITIRFPTPTTAGDNTIIIEYGAWELAPDVKWTLKAYGAWSNFPTANGVNDCNWYPSLKTDGPGKLYLKEEWFPVGSVGVSYQYNEYTGSNETGLGAIKIISVKYAPKDDFVK
jgi:hypothetical protein